ncbi:MAG: hypothetical protein Q7O04_05465 [Candidatus Omnitrophota bacterium]|nr:hypothetical protein [Candidatus Omnitrophota bacterium]
MKALKIMFSVVSFCLFIVSQCYATATTHIWAPSTDVQGYKKWHLTSDFYVPAESNSSGVRPNTITNFGLTVGVLPFEKLNAEVGFDYKSGYGDLDDYPWYFNAKAGIPEYAYGKFFPALAVGIYDVGTKENKTASDIVYAKVAKIFSAGDLSLGRVSLGGFSGDGDILLHGDKKDNKGLLFAWERPMPEISDKLWVCLEYQGTRSSYGAWNAGFSWKFADNVSGLFGYDFYNDKDLADTYTVQLDIDF